MGSDILSCGHPPTPTDGGGTGYARIPDEGDRKVCYSCADDLQRAKARVSDRFTAYLSSDGGELTTWSGGHLASARVSGRGRRTSWGRMTYVSASTPDGRQWYGVSGGGEGCVVTVRARVGSRIADLEREE